MGLFFARDSVARGIDKKVLPLLYSLCSVPRPLSLSLFSAVLLSLSFIVIQTIRNRPVELHSQTLDDIH